VTGETTFWGKYPLAWVGFAVLMLAIPLVALARESGARATELLPTLNATLNALSAALLVAGYRAVRAGNVALHWRLMLTATCTSALFLVFYLIRVSLTGTHAFPVPGAPRVVYLVILGTHTVLAAAVPFLAVRTLYLASRRRFDAHRRLARWTFPIWIYVSVTGVLVYAMLYHLAPALQ
jgi:putative membrane protein